MKDQKANHFEIALTGDFRTSEGDVYFDPAALKSLQGIAGARVEVLDTPVGTPVMAETLSSYDALVMKRSPVVAEEIVRADLRVVHISRNGVGLEHFDLQACTRAGIMITNTPESVQRPMASSAITMILALAHRLPEKNRAVREGRWADRHRYRGIGLTRRVLGLIGCGNIGRELLHLAAPWEMDHLVYDPFQSAESIAAAGGRQAGLDELLSVSDFVVLCCPLTEETHHIIDNRALNLMKQGAFLVNVARGPLVDETAVLGALEKGRLAGAGLDVFDPEPPDVNNLLVLREEVIATGHNLGFTDESNQLGNRFAAAAVETAARGDVPNNLVNPEVLEHPRIKSFLNERKK